MREIFANDIVPMALLTIIGFVVVSWFFEKARHRRAIRSALFDPDHRDDSADEDPDDVGMNDKEIL